MHQQTIFFVVTFNLLSLCVFDSESGAVDLRIRARTRGTLEVFRAETALFVRGQLLGDQGGGLSGEPVSIRAGQGDVRTLETDESGRVEVVYRGEDLTELHQDFGPQLRIEMVYEGDSRYGAVHASKRIDLQKRPLQLSVTVLPTTVRLGAEHANAIVEAHDDLRPVEGIERRRHDGPPVSRGACPHFCFC